MAARAPTLPPTPSSARSSRPSAMLLPLLLATITILCIDPAAAATTATRPRAGAGYSYQALAAPCAPAGPPMVVVNATSLADCQSQCTKQRDAFNGCAAALEKLCGLRVPRLPCVSLLDVRDVHDQ